jgi:desulfoferrodoxin-like iron-binding protein
LGNPLPTDNRTESDRPREAGREAERSETLATQREIYKCEVCGNIVEVLHGGEGDLVCCGENMKRMAPHAKADEDKEKHVPVIAGAHSFL